MITKIELDREFLIYKPKKDIIIPINNKNINIKILNFLENENSNKNKDRYNVYLIKKINFKNVDYLGFQIDKFEFKEF